MVFKLANAIAQGQRRLVGPRSTQRGPGAGAGASHPEIYEVIEPGNVRDVAAFQ